LYANLIHPLADAANRENVLPITVDRRNSVVLEARIATEFLQWARKTDPYGGSHSAVDVALLSVPIYYLLTT
jgi:hypothetical protein